MTDNRLGLWMALLALLAAFGCDDLQKVQPESRGQRGESCLARNDCEGGLACINAVCSKNDFPIEAAAKQCDRVDCQADADCCGDKPREAPAKCNNRTSVCSTRFIDGCAAGTACTADGDCNGGACGAGRCARNFTACTADADCAQNTCTGGFCALDGSSCTADADCLDNSCGNRTCDCQNPDYDPSAPICSDADCDDLCTLRCQDEQCVPDNSCDADAQCLAFGLTICDDGTCVECTEDDDCDTDGGESCVDNSCQTPCTVNEECPLFQACEGGECVETGCTSDRECVLASIDGIGEDARLSQCLPADDDSGLKVCKVPCENDGACGEMQVCEAGFCKFIGCDDDEECRAYLRIQNEMTSDARPFVSRAVCR